MDEISSSEYAIDHRLSRLRWKPRMLADKMVELEVMASVSHETIRRTLKKVTLNLGKRKNGVFHQSKMQPLSVKWKKS